jgi:serine acetyltransferase
MDTTDYIGTMATILGHHTIGPTDTAITATTVIITTIGTKLTLDIKSTDLAGWAQPASQKIPMYLLRSPARGKQGA